MLSADLEEKSIPPHRQHPDFPRDQTMKLLRQPQLTLPMTRRQMLEASLAVSAAMGIGGFSARVGHAAPSQKWLTIEKIERTTVKLPYRETPGRNMARELPHWAWTEIIEVTLKSGQVGIPAEPDGGHLPGVAPSAGSLFGRERQ
jgi:hypothetical protein